MKTLRESVEGEFSIVYQQAERMAGKFGVTPSIPRTAARQLNRNNVPALTPEEYFLRALNTFVSEMEFRFNKFSTKASKVLYLVPTVLCSDIYTGQLDDVVNMDEDIYTGQLDDVVNMYENIYTGQLDDVVNIYNGMASKPQSG